MIRRRNRTLTPFGPNLCIQPVHSSGSILVPNIDYAYRWWWRVRKWRFEHALTYGGTPYAAPSIDFFAHDESFLIGGDGAPAFESELECRSTPGIAWEDTAPGPPAWIWDLTAMTAVSYDGATVRVGFGASFHVDDANDLRGPGIGAEGDSDAGAVTMLFDGVAVPLFQSASSDPWAGTITFTPILFWGQSLPDGSQPVWDTVTGARLIADTSRLPVI